MKKLTILLIFFFLVGCSPAFVISDRMSYNTQKQLSETLPHKCKVKITIDEQLKTFILQQRPSGFTGGGISTIFNVGESFSAFIEQGIKEVYTEKCDTIPEIKVSKKDFLLDFTYSALSALSFQGAIPDYVKIKTQIEIVSGSFVKIYPLETEIDLPAKDMGVLTQRDRAFTLAFEDLTRQLISQMLKDNIF